MDVDAGSGIFSVRLEVDTSGRSRSLPALPSEQVCYVCRTDAKSGFADWNSRPVACWVEFQNDFGPRSETGGRIW